MEHDSSEEIRRFNAEFAEIAEVASIFRRSVSFLPAGSEAGHYGQVNRSSLQRFSVVRTNF